MIQGPDGALYLVGRYRNRGDSRTGLAVGERGLELAVFRSRDKGVTFDHLYSLSKEKLSGPAGRVLSIEGSCIVKRPHGFSLFVSTEKERAYPAEVEPYRKEGTGVWSIDELVADTPEAFANMTNREVLRSEDPAHLHVKDPFWAPTGDGMGRLYFCTHPYNWSSTNTAHVALNETDLGSPVYESFPRGTTWDVAISRATCVFGVAGWKVLLYDGGECMRRLDEHDRARKRPRGYSCEELGGAALLSASDSGGTKRLSRLHPLFVSPWGTGCSRYVDVIQTGEGYFATWQQSQPDESQPLVMNFVSREEAQAVLGD